MVRVRVAVQIKLDHLSPFVSEHSSQPHIFLSCLHLAQRRRVFGSHVHSQPHLHYYRGCLQGCVTSSV
jgi:hypothetical protein